VTGAATPDPISLQSASADQTVALAAAIAGLLRPGDVVLLVGDLGAGKTTFVKGLARAMGVTETVTSPTFTLVRSYATDMSSSSSLCRSSGVRTLVHADLFRLDRLREVVDLAIGEMLEDDAVALVEWGDVAVPVLGREALFLTLELGESPDERLVSIETPGSWSSRRRELLELTRPWH